MSYTYGVKGISSEPTRAPGTPPKEPPSEILQYTRIVTAGSGSIYPPIGAKSMRVAAIGGGGGSTSGAFSSYASGGGGGGGCAASKIVPASVINYTVGNGGSAGVPGSPGQDTIAVFLNYTLIGGGGSGGVTNTTVAGGLGRGGDYNWQGGSGAGDGGQYSYARGGGGAGPLELVNGVYVGWGVVRGGSGVAGMLNYNPYMAGASGAGAGSPLFDGSNGNYIAPGLPGGWVWGSISTNRNGAEMGGGASAYTSGTSGASGNGGAGGIVVEWFY